MVYTYLHLHTPTQVLSIGIEGVTLSQTSNPIIYRIYTDQNLGLVPDEDE